MVESVSIFNVFLSLGMLALVMELDEKFGRFKLWVTLAFIILITIAIFEIIVLL